MEFDNGRHRLVHLYKYTAGDWRSYERIAGLSHAHSMRSSRQCCTAVPFDCTGGRRTLVYVHCGVRSDQASCTDPRLISSLCIYIYGFIYFYKTRDNPTVVRYPTGFARPVGLPRPRRVGVSRFSFWHVETCIYITYLIV